VSRTLCTQALQEGSDKLSKISLLSFREFCLVKLRVAFSQVACGRSRECFGQFVHADLKHEVVISVVLKLPAAQDSIATDNVENEMVERVSGVPAPAHAEPRFDNDAVVRLIRFNNLQSGQKSAT
jgi:hypothetical protein